MRITRVQAFRTLLAVVLFPYAVACVAAVILFTI